MQETKFLTREEELSEGKRLRYAFSSKEEKGAEREVLKLAVAAFLTLLTLILVKSGHLSGEAVREAITESTDLSAAAEEDAGVREKAEELLRECAGKLVG